MAPNFQRGVEEFSSGPFTAHLLPSDEKERLCQELLEEFGATHISRRGEELVVCCVLPDHDDTHPSAQLNYEKLTYKCFSCDSSGGLLWLIGMCRGGSASQARKWLAKQTGDGAVQGLSELLAFFDALYGKKAEHKEPIPKFNKAILDPWMFIHPYLTEVRGIPESTLLAFKVGWDPATNRIVIPHFWKGDLVGWQTRRLDPTDGPKYKSSVSMPKDSTIYNYEATRERAIVVESPMSVLSKWHVYANIEATFGASVTDGQVRCLRRHRSVVLFFDNDDAGWKATEHVGKELAQYANVEVANNPYAADAADLSDEKYEQCLAERVPFALWKRPSSLLQLPPQEGNG